jgi:hypothetical protein
VSISEQAAGQRHIEGDMVVNHAAIIADISGKPSETEAGFQTAFKPARLSVHNHAGSKSNLRMKCKQSLKDADEFIAIELNLTQSFLNSYKCAIIASLFTI